MPLFGPPNVERLKAKGDVQGLIKALGYIKDANIRWASAGALGELGDVQAVEPLIAALKGQDEDMRRASAGALGQIGDVRAVEPLIAALKDQDEDVRRASARALGQIGDVRAVESLVVAFKDEGSYVREAATEALVEFGEAAVEPLVALFEEDKDVRGAASEALVKIGPAAVKPLVPLLKNEDVREAALEALEKIGPAAVKPLASLLESKDMREAASEALIKIGPAAVDSLVALLGGDYPVRKAASEALLEIGPAAVDSLVARIARARQGPGWSGEAVGSAASLAPFHQDPDSQVRQRVVTLLVKIGDAALEPLVTLAMTHPTEGIISVLQQVLERASASITPENLRTVACLNDMVQNITSQHICGYEERKVDCSRVRQLARQELIRRGLEA